jgi:hypothetical protein
LVKEDAFVWDLHRIQAGHHSVSIIDVSRNGMCLESADRLGQGSHIAIDFRGMIVCGTVQYCKMSADRFAMGVRINDVLDPLGEEVTNYSADGCAGAEAVGALA